MADDGAGLRKPVAPNVAVALAGTSAAGMLPIWQLSHDAVVGMCEAGPAGEVCGNTMMLVMPLKLPPVIVGPWQVAQPEVIRVWLNLPPANVVMPPVAPVAGINMVGMLLT